MNATASQIERANKVMSMGCKLPFEKILEIEIKKDLRNAPKQVTKKDIEKRAIRNSTITMSAVEIQDYFELQRENQKRLLY